LLLVGPAGSATSGLARRLVDLLPDLTADQVVEVARVYSAAGLPVPSRRRPPLRSPNGDVSVVSLLGGGSRRCGPGEVSLAHRGVLVLDEVTELALAALDALTHPLDTGSIRVVRGTLTAVLPARFVLAATMSPCPCGAPAEQCRCSEAARARYTHRIPTSLRSRFDLRIDMDSTSNTVDVSRGRAAGRSWSGVAARVAAARERARSRGVEANACLSPQQLNLDAPLSPEADRVVDVVVAAGQLTGAGVYGLRRVALTVADLQGDVPPLNAEHIHTALRLRSVPQPPPH
jgi:magnesium chelatase family protein